MPRTEVDDFRKRMAQFAVTRSPSKQVRYSVGLFFFFSLSHEAAVNVPQKRSQDPSKITVTLTWMYMYINVAY